MISSYPHISVVMPVYNAAKYLRESIDSIIGQSYTDFEFIIINDGSTDSTESIINSYKDSRIKYHKNDINRGIIYCLNKAIRMAKGSLIARMDADDISDEKRLEIQTEFLSTNSKVIVVGSAVHLIDEEGRRLEKSVPRITPNLLRWEAIFSTPMAHPTVLFRKKEIVALGLYKDKLHAEDYDLWTRVLIHHECANIQQALLCYRIHNSSITLKNNSKQKKNS